MDNECAEQRQFRRKYRFWVIIRKIAVVFGLYACLAVIFLILHYLGISLRQDEYHAASLVMALFGGLFLFLFLRWEDFIIRLRNCNFTDYPAMLVFFCVWIGVCFYFKSSFTELSQYIFITGCPPVALTSFLLIARKYGKNGSKILRSDQDHIANLSVAEIIKWAQNDKPSEKDYFNFTLKAQKIADRLIKNIEIDGKGNATVGLRGRFGSGKSTITELVKNIVNDAQQDILFVQASCWGFDDTQSMQEYIIRQIIDGMTESGLEIDHLIGIPRQYVRALAKTHAVFDAIVEAFYKSKTPEEILNAIDNVLCYKQKKLVLILEDLDRNQSDDFKLENVVATLRRLRDTKHISFIITGFYRRKKESDKEYDEHIDFAKICDYTDEVPMISNKDKYDCLVKIAEYHNDENVLKPETQNGEDSPIWSKSDYLLIPYPHRALLELIDTPRLLKIIIRDLDAAWKKSRLRGECDYMELLMLTVLRNLDDPIFDFILENLSKLRGRDAGIKKDQTYEQYQPILDWLFFQDSIPTKSARRICNEVPIDYFVRIVNEHVPEDHSDQKQLRAIQNWNNGTDGETKEALIEIIAGANEHNFGSNNRWFDTVKITNDDAKDLIDIIISKIHSVKDQHYPIITLRHLLLLQRVLQQQFDWKPIIQRLLEGLEGEQRPIFNLLARELIFRERAGLDSPWCQDMSNPSNGVFQKIDPEQKIQLMTKLSEEVEPVRCSDKIEIETLKANIAWVQQGATAWIKANKS